MTRWMPGAMPKLRDQTAAVLLDPNSHLRTRQWTQEMANQIRDVGSNLAVSDLYWVSPEMTELAMHAARELDEIRWSIIDRPSVYGLIIWENGLFDIQFEREEVTLPIVAMSWGPHPDGLLVAVWLNRRTVEDEILARGAQVVAGTLPPLVPVGGRALPPIDENDGFVRVEAIVEQWPAWTNEADDTCRLLSILYATWTLMQQESIAQLVVQPVDKKIAKAYGHRQQIPPTVLVVTLRVRRPPSGMPHEKGESSREYHHQWIVSGHWRNQPYGPGRSEYRKRWIAPYTKGPEDAPLLVKDRVNLWRR